MNAHSVLDGVSVDSTAHSVFILVESEETDQYGEPARVYWHVAMKETRQDAIDLAEALAVHASEMTGVPSERLDQ